MRSTWSWSAARTLRSTLAGLAAIAAPALAQAQQASIGGRITDKASGQPIQEARILVIGTSLFTSSGADGRYTLRNVPAGTAEIRVLRVGFQEQKRSVPVVAGQTATLDITMTQSVVQLDEVVTTATGQQRRTELGNSVTNLDANKILANAPIHQMGDLLVAKAPGVQVLPSNMTGGGSRVRVRGTASLSLSNDPIYIIDGIRMTSDNGSAAQTEPQCRRHGAEPGERPQPGRDREHRNRQGPVGRDAVWNGRGERCHRHHDEEGEGRRAAMELLHRAGKVQDKNTYPAMYAILGHSPRHPRGRQCSLNLVSVWQNNVRLDSTTSANLLRQIADRPFADGAGATSTAPRRAAARRRFVISAAATSKTKSVRWGCPARITRSIAPTEHVQDSDSRRVDPGRKFSGRRRART